MSSTRRAPLGSNPNIANSPLRASIGLSQLQSKLKRSFGTVQREEPYVQAPPSKRQQLLDHGAQRSVTAKPGQSTIQRATSAIARERASAAAAATAAPRARHEEEPRQTACTNEAEIELWRNHHRSRFPKMVFYFESIPPEIHAKLTRRIMRLGAKEEKFFSIDVTHVVTSRPIPLAQKVETQQQQQHHHHEPEQSHSRGQAEQPQTINPYLLDRSADVRRKMMLDLGGRRQQPPPAAPPQDDIAKRARAARSTDVLCKARNMGKKIWSLDKFQTMLSTLLEVDHGSASGTRAADARSGASRRADDNNLMQMLRREQLTGPSDRVVAEIRDLVHFRGPYIYVYDMEEKHKPIMIREYSKVANKTDGEWPQFQSVTNGRCPFIAEEDTVRQRAKAAAAAATTKTTQKTTAEGAAARPVPERAISATETAMANPEPRKRGLGEMDDGHRSRTGVAMNSHLLEPVRQSVTRRIDFRPFAGRISTGRQVAGEPVASGMQPSAVTSAIRSQMISSTGGAGGIKAGTSKEVYDLQRKVLQRAGSASQAVGSRQYTEVATDRGSSGKPPILERARTLEVMDEPLLKDKAAPRGLARAQSMASQPVQRDPKPGYCENCADKFRDFEEHIVSRKHRRFADSAGNFMELDELLQELRRKPKYSHNLDADSST